MSGQRHGETDFQPRCHEQLSCGEIQTGLMRHPNLTDELIPADIVCKRPDGANNNRTGLDSGFVSGETEMIWANLSTTTSNTPVTESALASLFRQMSQAGVDLGSRESEELQFIVSPNELGNGDSGCGGSSTERNHSDDSSCSEEDGQESHTSSLESLDSTGADGTKISCRENQSNRNGNGDDISLGCTTSCSSDSFELTSPPHADTLDKATAKVASLSELVVERNVLTQPAAPRSKEVRLSTRQNPFLAAEHPDSVLTDMDTHMPTFDFDRLEKQLQTAIKEQENKDKLLMSDHVRKEMRIFGDETRPYPAPAATRPQRSNLGSRLKIGRDLQICFMNDSGDMDKDTTTAGMDRSVCKSKSTPLLGDESTQLGGGEESDNISLVPRPGSTGKSYSGRNNTPLGRSVSSCSDSSLRASELRRAAQQLEDVEMSENLTVRQQRLEREAKVMLGKAKLAAHMQMEVEKQNINVTESQKRHSYVDELVGFSVGRKRVTRPQLTKMNITQLQLVVNEAHGKIKVLNEELVQLLIERDSLHMEQDSMLVDIEDLLQHQKCSNVKLPEFLVLTNPSHESSSKLRIFKK